MSSSLWWLALTLCIISFTATVVTTLCANWKRTCDLLSQTSRDTSLATISRKSTKKSNEPSDNEGAEHYCYEALCHLLVLSYLMPLVKHLTKAGQQQNEGSLPTDQTSTVLFSTTTCLQPIFILVQAMTVTGHVFMGSMSSKNSINHATPCVALLLAASITVGLAWPGSQAPRTIVLSLALAAILSVIGLVASLMLIYLLAIVLLSHHSTQRSTETFRLATAARLKLADHDAVRPQSANGDRGGESHLPQEGEGDFSLFVASDKNDTISSVDDTFGVSQALQANRRARRLTAEFSKRISSVIGDALLQTDEEYYNCLAAQEMARKASHQAIIQIVTQLVMLAFALVPPIIWLTETIMVNLTGSEARESSPSLMAIFFVFGHTSYGKHVS